MAVLVSQSNIEPVSVAEVKVWAKIEHDDEDDVLDSLITSCRDELERYLKIAFVTQVWRDDFEQLDGAVYSPRLPLTAASITVDAVVHTEFKFNQATGRVKTDRPIHDADVVVTYTSTVTALQPVLKTALLDLISYRFYNRGSAEAMQIPIDIKNRVQHMRAISI
jgi:hypothetical protein